MQHDRESLKLPGKVEVLCLQLLHLLPQVEVLDDGLGLAGPGLLQSLGYLGSGGLHGRFLLGGTSPRLLGGRFGFLGGSGLLLLPEDPDLSFKVELAEEIISE